MQPKHALVFDSGIGGLSICGEIIAAYPGLEIRYVSDNAAFPYGGKSAQELVARALRVIGTAIEQQPSDIIVVACNTASTVILPALRERFAIPVVGVVPAIKTAAACTRSGSIGLLATPGTVARDYTRTLIAEHAAALRVISVGSSELVELIEAHIYGAALDIERVRAVLEEFDAQPGAEQIDTVVLGCTHFPLIRNTLVELRDHWRWIDSGSAIAARVVDLLGGDTVNSAGVEVSSHSAWFTRAQTSSKALDNFLHKLGFTPSQQLYIA